MSLKHGLLGLINYTPLNGYELDRIFKDSLNFFWKAQTTQLYRELVNMEKIGWLKVELLIQSDKPNKKIYFITDEGRTEFTNWLLNEKISLSSKNDFLLKLFFVGELPKENALKILYSYKKECYLSLENLAAIPSKIKNYEDMIDSAERTKYWSATHKFGVSYMNMCINWVDSFIQELEV